MKQNHPKKNKKLRSKFSQGYLNRTENCAQENVKNK